VPPLLTVTGPPTVHRRRVQLVLEVLEERLNPNTTLTLSGLNPTVLSIDVGAKDTAIIGIVPSLDRIIAGARQSDRRTRGAETADYPRADAGQRIGHSPLRDCAANIHSRIGRPSTRCSFTNRSMRSAVMPEYHVPSG
jgi:hypothetical protein